LEHKKNCTKTPPVLIMNDSEEPVPSDGFSRAVLSRQPPSPSRKDSHRESCGSSGDTKEKPGTESVVYLKTEPSLPPTPQDISYLHKGKVANTNVTLQALWGTKVAVNQRSVIRHPHQCRAPTASLGCWSRSCACSSSSCSRSAHRADPSPGERVGSARLCIT
jgi:hypothetical protein